MNTTLLANKGIVFPGSGQDFATEDGNTEIYRLELANKGTSAVDKVIALCPGDGYSKTELSNLLGITVDAVITDGEIITTADAQVTCEGSPAKVEQFKRSFLRNPQRFTSITIDVDNVAQLNQPLIIFDDDVINGFKRRGQILPSGFKTNTQQNDKMVHIPLDHFQLDADTVVLVTLKKDTTLTLSMRSGAYVSNSFLLKNEAEREFSAKQLKRVMMK